MCIISTIRMHEYPSPSLPCSLLSSRATHPNRRKHHAIKCLIVGLAPTPWRKRNVDREALPPFLPPFLDVAGPSGIVAVLMDGNEEDGRVLVESLLPKREGRREGRRGEKGEGR